MSPAGVVRSGALHRAWSRWRFHLSGLVVLVPLALLPAYFEELAADSGSAGLGAREIGARKVGPWTVRLAEADLLPPQVQGLAGPIKPFSLALQGSAVAEVRAAYVKVGKPRSLRAAGAIFFGSPYRLTAGLALPRTTAATAQIWLTLEGWDGSVHQASLPLAEASPVTERWLTATGAAP
jgi:hypothetical protein